MIVWITDGEFPADAEVQAEAEAAGAEQILHGIPPALADVIPVGTLGAFDVPDPESVEHVDPLRTLLGKLKSANSLAAMRAAAAEAEQAL